MIVFFDVNTQIMVNLLSDGGVDRSHQNTIVFP